MSSLLYSPGSSPYVLVHMVGPLVATISFIVVGKFNTFGLGKCRSTSKVCVALFLTDVNLCFNQISCFGALVIMFFLSGNSLKMWS